MLNPLGTCSGVINLKLGSEMMISQYGELTTEETCITCQTATRGSRQQGRHVPREGAEEASDRGWLERKNLLCCTS